MAELHGGLTRAEVQAMFERRQRAMDACDASALAADYAAGAVIESPAGGTHVGPVEAERTLNAVFEALDPKVATEAVVVDGDRVAWVMRIEGVNFGSLLGLPPSGKPFSLTAVFLHELRDGRIVHEQRIYDFTGLLVQIGVLKAKPA